MKPKYLWFLMLSYTMVMAFANWFDPRIVEIFGLPADAGTIIFPFTFLISDMITEVYGYQHARRAIWCGFLFNLVFIVYSQIVIHLPSPAYATQNKIFDTLLIMNVRIIVASIISYFISEPLNSYLIAKLKIKQQGRYMALRFVASTIISAAFDSTIFSTLAFYGTMPNHDLHIFILDMWLIKVAVEIIGLPLSIRLVNFLKRSEQLDVYDQHTNFTLFSLKANYRAQDNQFLQQ